MTPTIRRRKLALLGGATALVLALPLSLQVSAEGSSTSTTTVASPTQIVRVSTPTLAARNKLAKLKLDIAGTVGRSAIDVVVDSSADKTKLKRAGFSWTVVVEDVEAAERARRAADKAYAAAKPGGSALPSGRTSYRTLAQFDAEIQALAADYIARTRLINLAHPSLENRTIRALEVSNGVNVDDGKPTLLVMGAHHAREWPSAELTLEFAYDLLQNADVPRIANILDNVRVLFVPVVNPDGFNVSRSGTYALKRKNCRLADGQLPALGACNLRANKLLGTDPNRNYGALWGGPGVEFIVTSEIYPGAGPFSEPESQNIRELVSERQVVTSISNHTYGGLVLRPPGTLVDFLSWDEAVMAPLGQQMASEMGYQNIFGFQLYNTTGTTDDWVYEATGGLAFTFEFGTNGFHPTFSSIVPQYTGGTKKVPGGGVRAALLIAAESTANSARHSVIEGTATAGRTLRLSKSFLTETWAGATFTDNLDDTMVVPSSGSYTWHVNPSTRPALYEFGLTESWTLTCEDSGGNVLDTAQVTVDRGATVTKNLTC